uniref:Tryptophan 5-hydroxylase 2 n=1 Tax=Sphaerodactylus townsendi TaxID=933632 RepID=A0ACB8FP49_9SAUR
MRFMFFEKFILKTCPMSIFLQLNRTGSGKIDDKKGNTSAGKNESTSESGKTAVVFSLKNEVGGLVKALRLFQEKHVSMVHIESRKSKRRNSEVEIFVDCDCSKKQFNELIQLLKYETNIVTLNPPENIWTDEEELDCVPWFPRKIADLDKCSQRVLMYGSELDADHPYPQAEGKGGKWKVKDSDFSLSSTQSKGKEWISSGSKEATVRKEGKAD